MNARRGSESGRRAVLSDRDRTLRWAVPVALAVLPFVVLGPAMVSGVMAIEDGWIQYFPIRTIAAEQVAAGHLPAWTGAQFSGLGVYELGHVGVLYPLNLLGAFVSPMLAYNVALASALSVSLTGTYLAARRLAASRCAASVAAIGFAFGPFMVSELSHPDMLTSLAWLPWALLGLLVARSSERRWLGVVGTAAALAMCVLGGHQQMVACLVMLVLGWGVCSSAVARDRRAADAVNAVAATALGLGLAAVQLLPSAVAASRSGRAGYSYAEATSFTLELRQLPLLLFPYASGGPGADLPVQVAVGFPFLGVVLVLLAVGAVPYWRRERWIAAALLLTAAVAVASLSPILEPLGRLVYPVPLFGWFRGWTRYLLIPKLMVALLAASTLTRLVAGDVQDRRRIVRWVGSASGVYVAAAAATRVLPVLPDPRTTWLLVPAALAAVTAALVVVARRRPAWGVAGLLLLVVVEVALVSPTKPWSVPTVSAATVEAASAPSARERLVPSDAAPLERYLYLGSYDGVPSTGLVPRAPLTGLSGAQSVNGYTPLAPQRYLDALGMDFYGSIDDPGCLLDGPSADVVLDLLSVRSILVPEGSAAADELGARGTLFEVPGSSDLRWDREPDLPSVWASPSSDRLVTDDAGGELACAEMPVPRAEDVEVLEADVERGRFVVRTTGSAPRDVVFSVATAPGWVATVDGRTRPVTSMAGLVVSVPVPAGDHVVELDYRVPRLAEGAALSLLASLVAAAVLVRHRRAGRPVRAGDGEPDRDRSAA